MFAFCGGFVKQSPAKNSIINISYRLIKFWSESQNSSESGTAVVKSNRKASLAYYSLDLNYLTRGKPNPIIIYHNLFTSKDMFVRIAKPLAQRTGRVVYLLDMRNHGESPHSDVEQSDINSMAIDVNDFMDEFGLNRAVLVGHGIGSLAMLRTSALFESKVEKVVAVDIQPIDLPLFGTKLLDRMHFSVSSLPQDISLSFARMIVKKQLNRYFRDKLLLQYILLNLKADENGFIKWRFNLPVIRQLLIQGIDRSTAFEGQYSDEVLVVNGKYGSMSADTYTELKNTFPKVKFEFYNQFRRQIRASKKPKELVDILVNFIGKPKTIANDSK